MGLDSDCKKMCEHINFTHEIRILTIQLKEIPLKTRQNSRHITSIIHDRKPFKTAKVQKTFFTIQSGHSDIDVRKMWLIKIPWI